jgi:hypothetical protein
MNRETLIGLAKRTALVALILVAAPADARCGGARGHCGYRYYTPTDAERIVDLESMLHSETQQNSRLQVWLFAISTWAALATIGGTFAAVELRRRNR